MERFVERAKAIRVGDPMDLDTQMGPVISERQLTNIERYVAKGREEGATVVTGGKRPEGLADGGYYYEPTVFLNVTNDMTIAREEIFGPVVSIIEFDGDDEAVAIANASDYGLAGAVWSKSEERALGVADRIDTGTIWINDYHLLDPQFPFGGYKKSGFGRELGPEGLEAYMQVKHIHVGESSTPDDKYYTGILLD